MTPRLRRFRNCPLAATPSLTRVQTCSDRGVPGPGRRLQPGARVVCASAQTNHCRHHRNRYRRDGAVLPGVTVAAVCTDTNLTRTSVTDAQGGFRLSELPICSVQRHRRASRVSRPSAARHRWRPTPSPRWTSTSKSARSVGNGHRRRRVAADRVLRQAQQPRRQPSASKSMPLSGRDFNSLLNVTPGVQHNPGGGFQGVNVSGARDLVEQLHDRRHLEQRPLLRRHGAELDRSRRRAGDARARRTRSATSRCSRRRRPNSASRAARRSTS